MSCTRLGSGGPGADTWVQQAAASRFKLGSTAFVRVCATAHLSEIEASAALLRTAFLHMPSLQTLLMVAGGELSFTEPGGRLGGWRQ